MLLNIAITLIAITMLVLLLAPAVREHRSWQATVTPLASVVGSGFLIMAPLLHEAAGSLAVPVMLVIVGVAAAMGMVMRYNIRHLEPLLREPAQRRLALLERCSDFSLIIAYVISVAFYLSLLSAFVLRFVPSPLGEELGKDVLTTAILVLVAVQGWRGGLHRLEVMEEYSVSIKLAIIVALLFGLGVYFFQHPLQLSELPLPRDDGWHRIRLIAGTLLVVQGFETSRYLGDAYDRVTRCRSMARAQWIAGVIYVLFVMLTMPLLYANGEVPVSETALIDMSVQVATVLAPLLLVAAVMSQFSAAVADTLGAGGLGEELSAGRLRAPLAYGLICAAAITLIWLSDVYQAITLASRAFAFYYLIQCILALLVMKQRRGWRQPAFILTALLALVMLLVVIFAAPVE